MVVNSRNGFAVETGKHIFFIESDKTTRCKSVVDTFIKSICDYRGFCEDLKNRCLADEHTRKDIQNRMMSATYELRQCDNGTQYHSLNGDNFIMNFPMNDCEELVFLN